MKVNFTKFRNAVLDLPEKDGCYTVVRFNSDKKCFSVSNINYTVAHGWNTFESCTEHGFDYSKDVAEDGDIVLWAELPTIEES